MHALQTAIIEHTNANGIHHDWLIEDPSLSDPKAAEARLWTARVTPPPQDWARLEQFELTVIPPHRRHYLTYQGPVPGNRGRVKQLDRGLCFASLWSSCRICLAVETQQLRIDLLLVRMGTDRWVARQASNQRQST